MMSPLFIYFCILINAESKSNQFKPFTTLQIRKYPSFPSSTTVQGLRESRYDSPRKQLLSEKVIKLNSKDNYTCIKEKVSHFSSTLICPNKEQRAGVTGEDSSSVKHRPLSLRETDTHSNHE